MRSIVRMIIIIFIAILLLLGVANLYFFIDKTKIDASQEVTTTTKRNKSVRLSFSDKACNSKTKEIYSFKDGRKIYSRCGDIYYYDDVNNKMTLGEAIDNKIIYISDITDKMETIALLYDGGTKIFEYQNEFNNLANTSFRLEICRQTKGKKDILFLSITSDDYMCS